MLKELEQICMQIPCKKPCELYFMEISKWRLTFGNVLSENCDAQICHDKCYGVRFGIVSSQNNANGMGTWRVAAQKAMKFAWIFSRK